MFLCKIYFSRIVLIFVLEFKVLFNNLLGAQWLSGVVLDSRPGGCGFEPYRGHCVVVLGQETFIQAYYRFNPGRPIPV